MGCFSLTTQCPFPSSIPFPHFVGIQQNGTFRPTLIFPHTHKVLFKREKQKNRLKRKAGVAGQSPALCQGLALVNMEPWLPKSLPLLCLGVLLVTTNIGWAILKLRKDAKSFFKGTGSPSKTLGCQVEPAKARQAQRVLARRTLHPVTWEVTYPHPQLPPPLETSQPKQEKHVKLF